MKIKVSKDYVFDQLMYESDRRFSREHDCCEPHRTYRSDYNSNWTEEDVNIDKLMEYINKGYAIKINC